MNPAARIRLMVHSCCENSHYFKTLTKEAIVQLTKDCLSDQLTELELSEFRELIPHHVLHLFTEKPDLIDGDVMQELVNVFKLLRPNACSLVNYEVIRLIGSGQGAKSWCRYETFLSRCLNNNVISPKLLESSVMPLLKSDFESDASLRKFASSLQYVVDMYKKEKVHSYREEEFIQILEWISWFCSKTEADFFDQIDDH